MIRRLGTGDLVSGDIASPSPSSPSLMPSATLLIWPDSSVLCTLHCYIKHATMSCHLLGDLYDSLHEEHPCPCLLLQPAYINIAGHSLARLEIQDPQDIIQAQTEKHMSG